MASLNLDTDAGRASVRQVCRLFGISAQAFYGARRGPRPRHLRLVGTDGVLRDVAPTAVALLRRRPPWASPEELRTAIRAIVDEHPAWGVRKVWATLRRAPYDIRAGHRRVYAFMKDMGLTLPADRPERVRATFGHVTTAEPNRRWATDLTTVWTSLHGLVAVVVVVDCGCRSLLAVAASKSQDSAAILAPVRQALQEQFGDPAGPPPTRSPSRPRCWRTA